MGGRTDRCACGQVSNVLAYYAVSYILALEKIPLLRARGQVYVNQVALARYGFSVR